MEEGSGKGKYFNSIVGCIGSHFKKLTYKKIHKLRK